MLDVSASRSPFAPWPARAILCLAVALVFGPQSAVAQRQLQVDDFRPAHDTDGFLGVQGTTTPGHLRTNFGLFTGYTFGLLRVNPDFTSQQVVLRHRLSMDAFMQIGLGGRLALALDVPFTPYQTGAPRALADGDESLDGAALGDLRVTARARLLGDAADGTDVRADGPGLAGMLTVTLPTAQGVGFQGARLPEVDLTLIGDIHIFGFGLGASLGARIRPERVRVGGRVHGSELHWGLAIAKPFQAYPDLVALLEFRGSSGFTGRYNSPTEIDFGLRLRAGAFHLSVLGVLGCRTARLAPPSVRAMLGLRYAPPHRDKDLDGIPDHQDLCPLLPEDFDGFEDEDGCMDPDNDNDLIPDADDMCPNETAEEGRDDDEDGCTDP